MNSRYFWPALTLLHILLRFPTFYTPILDIDETQFAGFAHVLMNGGLPYLDSLDTKPLGIYLFYQTIFTLFGSYNMIAVHIITAALHFGIALILYRTLKLFDLESIGKWAALFFVVFSTTFIPKYLATSINAIMIFFLTLSFYFFARSEKKLFSLSDFLAAFLLGIAFLFKYTAGIQIVCYGLAVLWFYKINFKSITRLLFLGVVFTLPFLFHFYYLKHLGVADDFWLWSIQGSVSYINKGGDTINFWQSFLIRFGTYALATVPLWYLALYTFKKLLFKSSARVLFFIWFITSLIPVFVGGRFYPHYFLHVLPALCGLAAFGIGEIKSITIKKALISLTAISAVLFLILRIDYKTYLDYFPDDQIYEQKEIGLSIKQISQPNDFILVWGFATAIDFYSELRPASRFLWSDLLTGRTPGPTYARQKGNKNSDKVAENTLPWKLFWQDLEKRTPTYFVNTSPANMHSYKRYSPHNYSRLKQFLEKNYETIDIINEVEIYKLK